MDGDFCEAGAIHALCQRTGALLVVDEAHAIGAYGPHGRGWMAAHGLAPESFIAVYPCGKAMAGAGAFVCAPAWLRDYLVNTARSFIYTTGPSPWVAAALCESIDTVRALDAGRAHLRSLVATVRAGLLELGFDLGRGDSHIVPVILGSEQSALAAEAFCLERNLHARAIRPPTVPEHGSRLRLSLHAGLSQGDAERVLGTFGELAAACKR
jgi:8-amino-7-oxononanoate synthase